jgi:sugar lactone lactonase YvrE
LEQRVQGTPGRRRERLPLADFARARAESETVMKVILPSLLAIALANLPTSVGAPVKTERNPGQGPVITFGEGFATPESVLYDPDEDEYLVSSINGPPVDTDNNGFITVLAPDGKVLNAKFIEGGKNGVTLHAPHGLALIAGRLYVADVDTVRVFERKSGKAIADISVAGATFLNDLCSQADGTLLITDSGLKSGKQGLEPSGSDAVYSYKDGRLRPVVKNKNLGHPNGIVATARGVWVVNYGNDELWELDLKEGKKGSITRLPKGTLDGIVALPDDSLLVSSWDGKAIYRGRPGGEFKEVLSGIEAPADIGLDARRNRLLVPRFQDNRVEAYALNALGIEASR